MSRVLMLDRREAAGAFADLGLLVPIAIALIVKNGLTPTAVLLPPAILALVSAVRYRLPVGIQPLKAFGVIAIAHHMSPDVIAAGSIALGATFLLLGSTGLVERAAQLIPAPVVRGVQLAVGLLLLKIAWQLAISQPKSFLDHGTSAGLIVGGALLVAALCIAGRRHGVVLWLVVIGLVVALARTWGAHQLGPSALHVPHIHGGDWSDALVLLLLPQIPLSFANSCVAAADTAHRYFPGRSGRVSAGRLAVSLGAVDLVAGAISGMPVCHGAGGMTAQRAAGARGAGAPALFGITLLTVALVFGSSFVAVLRGYPLIVLAGLLIVAGTQHLALARDLRGTADWALALAVAASGMLGQLAAGLVLCSALWWARSLNRPRPTRTSRQGTPGASRSAPRA